MIWRYALIDVITLLILRYVTPPRYVIDTRYYAAIITILMLCLRLSLMRVMMPLLSATRYAAIDKRFAAMPLLRRASSCYAIATPLPCRLRHYAAIFVAITPLVIDKIVLLPLRFTLFIDATARLR